MTKFTGSALYATFAGTAITGNFRELSTSESIDIVDATAGADVAKIKLTGPEDGSVSISILPDAASSTIWDALDKGNYGTLIWGEEGTTAANPKHTVYCVVSERSKTVPYADVVEMNFTLEYSGVVTDGTW